MTSDPLYIGLSRDEISKIIEFLRQYKAMLEQSKYPPHIYRADAIYGLIAGIERKSAIS